ncbi:hypothetical protein AA980_07120 [Neobacillus vireti]|nr:hypothetical protein AA980_07120 [Neobacillus vireti]
MRNFFKKTKAMLKHVVDFEHNVDWSGGRKTPAGAAGQVRPRRRFSAEEAHRPPRGKRSAWKGNQHSLLTQQKTKKPLTLGQSRTKVRAFCNL